MRTDEGSDWRRPEPVRLGDAGADQRGRPVARAMTVSNALVRPNTPRPPAVTKVKGLYLAGDWVGEEGILADAALGSARTAAKAILAS